MLLAGVAGSARTQAPEPGAGAPEVIELNFAWPTEVRAHVRSYIMEVKAGSDNGGASIIEYDLSTEHRPGNIHIQVSNIADGRPVKTPPEKPTTSLVMQATGRVLHSMTISNAGEFLSLDSPEQLLPALRSAAQAEAAPAPNLQKFIDRLAQVPQSTTQRQRNLWDALVGKWRHQRIPIDGAWNVPDWTFEETSQRYRSRLSTSPLMPCPDSKRDRTCIEISGDDVWLNEGAGTAAAAAEDVMLERHATLMLDIATALPYRFRVRVARRSSSAGAQTVINDLQDTLFSYE